VSPRAIRTAVSAPRSRHVAARHPLVIRAAEIEPTRVPATAAMTIADSSAAGVPFRKGSGLVDASGRRVVGA